MILVSSDVKIIGVTVDSSLSLNEHIASLSNVCYYHIMAIKHNRKSLTDDSARSIACAIVGSRLDYANVGVSAFNIKKLQRVQNTLARVVTHRYSYARTSKSLATLHWNTIKW